jgi:hypothetical protein
VGISGVTPNISDTVAPTIRITSPADGTLVSRNVVVSVDAADNVGVTRVELYVDGALTTATTSAPFTTNWNARKATRGAHTLQCKAFDAAGNVSVSQPVVVQK